MEENLTVQQLSQALNQLLDAYEELQNKNNDLKKELEDVQSQNDELKEQVGLLSSTTTEQNTEMDAMINRIESILGGSISDNQQSSESDITTEDLSTQTQELLADTAEEKESQDNKPKESQKDTSTEQPDLGRMQALLNGFNS